MPVPGEVMFSDEWMNRNSKGKVPQQFAKMCRDICKDFCIGDDNSIEMVWFTLKPHIKNIYKDNLINPPWEDNQGK